MLLIIKIDFVSVGTQVMSVDALHIGASFDGLMVGKSPPSFFLLTPLSSSSFSSCLPISSSLRQSLLSQLYRGAAIAAVALGPFGLVEPQGVK